jgi:hypothetical protein
MFSIPVTADTIDISIDMPTYDEMYRSWLVLVTLENCRYWDMDVSSIEYQLYDNAYNQYEKTFLLYYPIDTMAHTIMIATFQDTYLLTYKDILH